MNKVLGRAFLPPTLNRVKVIAGILLTPVIPEEVKDGSLHNSFMVSYDVSGPLTHIPLYQ